MDEETAVLSPRKRRDTQQPIAGAREEITYSYASSPQQKRDIQQPTAEEREENVYSYASRSRWKRRPWY